MGHPKEGTAVGEPTNAQILEALNRVESKLDALLAALVAEDEQPDPRTLDGELMPGERDQTQGLG
jgi:hypothetical protein